jgi:hypothetical protein
MQLAHFHMTCCVTKKMRPVLLTSGDEFAQCAESIVALPHGMWTATKIGWRFANVVVRLGTLATKLVNDLRRSAIN